MANLDVPSAEFGNGFAADFAGVGAFIFPKDVLRSRADSGGAQDAGGFGQGGQAR